MIDEKEEPKEPRLTKESTVRILLKDIAVLQEEVVAMRKSYDTVKSYYIVAATSPSSDMKTILMSDDMKTIVENDNRFTDGYIQSSSIIATIDELLTEYATSFGDSEPKQTEGEQE